MSDVGESMIDEYMLGLREQLHDVIRARTKALDHHSLLLETECQDLAWHRLAVGDIRCANTDYNQLLKRMNYCIKLGWGKRVFNGQQKRMDKD